MLRKNTNFLSSLDRETSGHYTFTLKSRRGATNLSESGTLAPRIQQFPV